MAKPTRDDFIAAARTRYSTQQPEPTESNEQGIIGDAVDMFQRGLGQTLGGDLETVGQLADSQGIKDAGRGVSEWADGQLQEASTPMREAMGKQFFEENVETGAIEAGDAWSDPRSWAGNFATVLGQFTGLVGGTKGAGLIARPALRGAGKLLAKDLVEGQARELVAKATVKDAIQAGALDSVKAAYLAAPGEAAKRAVLDKAIGRLTSIGYGAHAGAMASGMRAQQAEQEARGFLNGLGNDELNANPIYQQAYWDLADGEMRGAGVEEIRRAAIDGVAEKAATDAWSDKRALTADFLSGMLTGAGGGVGGLLGKVGSTRAGAAARGFVGEGATEAWQGGETQRAVNQAVQEWADETRDPMAGVLSSALNEGTIGGAFGGVVGGVRGPEAQAASKPVVRVERRVVTGDGQIDDMIHGLDQRQAERGAAIEREIDTLFAGKQNPLGKSGQAFDPVRDIPAYERQGFVRGSHDFRGTEIPGPLEGELLAPETGLMPLNDSTDLMPQGGRAAKDLAELAGGRMPPSGRQAVTDQRLDGDLMPQELGPERAGLPGATIEGDGREVGTELPYRDFIVGEDGRPAQRRAADIQRRGRELADQPAQIGQSDTIFVPGEPGADPRNSTYTPPRLSRDQVDRSLGEESTRDPRSPVAQSIEQAGSATDSVFGPLKSLRITRKGKPFATEKEAAMASRKDQEMPVPLNGGGFGVAAIGEVQQAQAQQGAVKQPSSNSAQQDRQDGKTEIAQNGMVIVHGSGNPGMSEQDIQIVRASGQKQGKKGRVYGGFYGTSEQDAHQAQAYADMMGGTPTLYDVKIKPGTKVLHKQGDITRLSESYINELVSQGYGVVTGTDPRGQTEHVVIDKSAVASMAPRGAQATPSQVNDTNVADIRQPSDQPAKSVSAETVPAPSATAGEASQLAPAIDTGYREVIPISQPKTEVSNEPVTPVPAISSEGQRDQPGAGEPAAAGAGPAVAGLTDRAGSGDRADLAAPAPVPDGQQQDDQALTTPATDAGVVVSEVADPTSEPAAAPQPWAEAIDNADGTVTLKGEVPIIRQWAKDNGVKAIPGKGGLVVAKSSAAKVRDMVAPAASEPVRQIEAARAEVAPEPTEAQKEAGNYKKGHLTLQGLDIALENPKGSTRSGTDQDGKAWQSTMAHDYGYIKRTLGADGDHVDVFIGDQPDSETVYVVDQVDPKTGKFDEHKVMMGFADEQAARVGYLGNYEAGWKGLGAIKAMPAEEFKRWMKEGDTTKPATDVVVAQEPDQSKVQGAELERAILFSKQAMAQGDKPARHLTRKEAELVTKGWFREYQGASGIEVKIHATQAELEQALGLDAKDGLIRRAAFDDDSGTLHVAADTIANPKRMREILRHEVLAHYGLANVLGDGEYTKLMSRLIQSQKDPSMKPVWDWVNTHYADEDIGTQAEEVVAHLAELEQGAWGRGWDRVVAWVTRALRAVGFVPDGITAAETRVLIESLGKKMKRRGPDDGGPDGGKKFSQEAQPARMSQEADSDVGGSSLRDVIRSIRDSGVTISATEKRGVINLVKISVDESERGNGKGTSAMRDIIGYADRTGQVIALSPSTDFGGNKSRLVAFYKGLGFVDNKGKNKDFAISESMYRPAKEKSSIRFSQANSTAEAAHQTGAALSSVKNWLKQGRPLMLGTLTDLQIDQVYRDITGGAVSQYQRLRTQMEADRNDILLDAETRIDPLWDALGKQEKADLSNLMHDATMARLHPDKSLDENSYYQEAKQKLERAKKPETKAAYEAELHIIERNHSELARQYNALPANAKALYDTMQDTYTKQWESLRGAIEQRLEDLLGVNQGRAMAAEMRQKMEHALQHGPYFPLTRYGDYVVKARKGDEYVREHFERRADAEQAVKQYQRDGYNAVMTVKEEGGSDSANANQLGMEMLNFLDNADGVSKTTLKDEIWQAMLRMMPDASYAKHAIHRRRVKGASRDAHRAYLNSVYHYARHVSKIRYGHKMQGELDKLSEQIRAGVAGEPSSLKPDDLEIAQQVLNEMNKRHDLNMNPTGKAWAGAAGNIGFLYYIGPSLASAVVNMTQNFTVMLPQLGAKYGFAKSASAMTEALRDYWRHGKFKAGTTEAWRSLTRSTTLPADERAMLERLYRSGALDLTQAHSIAAKADTDQQDAKPMSKGWRRAMRWAGATFHNAEVLNREVAALAAYRLLKQAEPTLDGQQYADRVAEMVYDGHGNYAASNRPRYMRNDITKVLTQFKIYSQMMTYVLYSNAIKAAKGDKVAAKTLAGVLATHWVMAGVMGLPTPIAAVAYALAAAFDDDDDRSGEASFRLALTETLGPRAGELLAKGPMDAITNLSIAGRTGLGDLWWRSPKEGTEGDDLAWHAVQQLLGPVAGIGINMARGAGQMTDGHIQRGLETVLPKSIRDAAKALRQATEGEQTIKGDVIMDDVSAWNVAMQAIGFGSAQMAKNYDARKYIKGKERRIADKRSELMADYYNARKSGDIDAVQEVLDHIKMFNATHNPGERITGKSLALSFKSKLRSNERTQGGVYLNRNREYLREEGRFAD
ncbi:PLxRFG domain-containing protein [Aeromonas media]|uniref:PLxRFG domain-containing protein n=1 Tax=Aeromonas media TaxID=651 RepID=UPI00148AEA89|nr:PLxRFG domain-containing protein [Aeromonas media]QJT28377.1 PLxRFG domain-containing protein [Aeromonas media]